MNLRLLLALLRLFASSGRRKAALGRFAGMLVTFCGALIFLFTAFGFGLSAGYGYLAILLPPPMAAAVMAATFLLAAVLLVSVPSALRRRRRTRVDAASRDPGLAAVLNRLSDWGRANPWEAAAAAFIVGLTLGSRR